MALAAEDLAVTQAEAIMLRRHLRQWSDSRRDRVAQTPIEITLERVRDAEEAAFVALYGVASNGEHGDTNGTM